MGRGDHSVGAGADLFDDLVFLVDDEGSAADFVEDASLGDGHLFLTAFLAFRLH